MTACTLGTSPFDFIPHPGPVLYYAYRGTPVPLWASSILPESELTPVRESEVEEGIERMVEQMHRASNMSGESIRDAILRMAGAMRS